MTDPLLVRPVQAADRPQWEVLWRQYSARHDLHPPDYGGPAAGLVVAAEESRVVVDHPPGAPSWRSAT